MHGCWHQFLSQETKMDFKDFLQLDEAGYGRNKGYAHGFASPNAPSLGSRRREDDEYHVPDKKPADHPHAVHINGKKWKSYGSQSHAQNVANKIKGATVHKEEVEIAEATTSATKLVHTRTGKDGAKYHIMQDSPTDYSIHREHNGKTKHIDTYGSLHRAKSVLDNEVKEEVELDESASELNNHISTFSKGVKSSAAKQSTYKRDNKPIHNMKHVETDASHKAVFDHLKKMGYKKTSGYDSKPNEFTIHHNRDEMTSKTDPVHHSSGVSAHVETEHGGKTKVHFTHRNMKEETMTQSFKGFLSSLTELTDKQKKHIDQNDNGKIDAHDFKLLRKEDEHTEQAPVAPVPDKKYIKGTPENKALKASRKPINGMPTGKMKEEVELDESVFDSKEVAHSMANKLKTKHDDGNYSVVADHGKHRVVHAYHSDSRVKKDIAKLNEEVELDELDKSTLKSYINKNIKSGRADDGGKGDTGLYRATNKVAGKLKTGTLDKKVKTLGNTSSNAHKNPYEYDASRSELKNRGIHNFAGRRTRTEEVEMHEAFINGREYASHGLMHPDHAKLHKTGETRDFYAHGSGDKVYGKVTKNDGKAVHMRDTSGKTHQFKVTPHLPKQQDEGVGFDNEGNLVSEKLTYSQFMEQLLEYTPGPGGVTRVQGRSYGAQYHDPEGDDNADDQPKAKPAKPADEPKRGRGRPAGTYGGAYKARSADTKAAAAAKAAASKAANKKK